MVALGTVNFFAFYARLRLEMGKHCSYEKSVSHHALLGTDNDYSDVPNKSGSRNKGGRNYVGMA